jgi:uncharacterized protein with von Willebrand factor type A (vWA) domain
MRRKQTKAKKQKKKVLRLQYKTSENLRERERERERASGRQSSKGTKSLGCAKEGERKEKRKAVAVGEHKGGKGESWRDSS